MSDAQTESAPTNPPVAVSASPPTQSRGPSVKQIAIVAAILGAGILVTALTANVTQTAEPGIRLQDGHPFLVDQVRDWSGSELQGLSEQELRILPPDTQGARRVYTNKDGSEVYCSVVLEGSDVTSIHRPELCLRGQGWLLENLHVQRIPVEGAPGGSLRISCLDAKRTVPLAGGGNAETRAVFAYWFVGKGRQTPYHWLRIILTTKDRVFLNRNARWAYFLIYAPLRVSKNEESTKQSEEQTMQVINRFVQDIYPTLVPE